MLQGLVPDIERTALLVGQISTASQELATGAAQVNLAIQELDKATQVNTSASQALSATADELSEQAEALRGSMGFFRTGQAAAAAEVTERPRRPNPAPAPAARPGRKLAGGGFELDMSASEDELDAQFARAGRAA